MTTAHNDQPTFFLPDLCGVRALFGVVVIGELLAVILTLVGSGIAADALDRLSLISLFTQWVGLSAAADRMATRNRRRDRELSIDSASGPGGQ